MEGEVGEGRRALGAGGWGWWCAAVEGGLDGEDGVDLGVGLVAYDAFLEEGFEFLFGLV